jgi:hypothetical protein
MAKAPKLTEKLAAKEQVNPFTLTAKQVRQTVAQEIVRPEQAEWDLMTRPQRRDWLLAEIQWKLELRAQQGHVSATVWSEHIQFNAGYTDDARVILIAAGFTWNTVNNGPDGFDLITVSAA